MNRIISINWNDLKSIRKGHLKRSRLKQLGYRLISKEKLNSLSILTYSKP